MIDNTCCFIGHRTIRETDELKARLYKEIEDLIIHKKINTFLFGSKSQFNDLCHKVVTTAKEKHPHIKRIYVRAEYPYINDDYKEYLLKSYEQTYFPDSVMEAGKAAYIKRNFEMIKNSLFCVVYYNADYNPTTRKSGTKIAVEYANKLNRHIINVMK